MRCSSSTVGSQDGRGHRVPSRRVIAQAMRAVGPLRVGRGVAAPAVDAQLERGDALLGHADDADGADTPGKASAAIAPPSSTTNHGRTPRRSTPRPPGWPRCRRPPRCAEGQPHVLRGGETLASSVSTASQIATSGPCRPASRGPRPRRRGSRRRTGCCRRPSSTGTTSRWAISTTGRPAPPLLAAGPGPAEEQTVVSTGQLSSGRSWRSRYCRSSSATNASNGLPCRPGSGRGGRPSGSTSACRRATAGCVAAEAGGSSRTLGQVIRRPWRLAVGAVRGTRVRDETWRTRSRFRRPADACSRGVSDARPRDAVDVDPPPHADGLARALRPPQ